MNSFKWFFCESVLSSIRLDDGPRTISETDVIRKGWNMINVLPQGNSIQLFLLNETHAGVKLGEWDSSFSWQILTQLPPFL